MPFTATGQQPKSDDAACQDQRLGDHPEEPQCLPRVIGLARSDYQGDNHAPLDPDAGGQRSRHAENPLFRREWFLQRKKKRQLAASRTRSSLRHGEARLVKTSKSSAGEPRLERILHRLRTRRHMRCAHIDGLAAETPVFAQPPPVKPLLRSRLAPVRLLFRRKTGSLHATFWNP